MRQSKELLVDVVKDQLRIHLFGLGIAEAHHPGSKGGGYTHIVDELFERHVMKAMAQYLKLKARGILPTKAPMHLPKGPNTTTLGTMFDLRNDIYQQTEEDRVRLRKEAEEERYRREARGD